MKYENIVKVKFTNRINRFVGQKLDKTEKNTKIKKKEKPTNSMFMGFFNGCGRRI